MILAQTTQAAAQALTPAGWTFMLASILFVVGLLTYCFARVFSTPDNSNSHMHAPLDIDTQDAE